MFSLKEATDTVYRQSVLSKDEARYGYITTEKTPHLLAPDAGSVFRDPQLYREKLLPLLRIDLQALNPALRGVIPFVYYENPHLNYVCMQLDENHLVEAVFFVGSKGKRHEISDKEVQEFEEGWEEVERTLASSRGRYYSLDITTPFPGDLDCSDQDTLEDWLHTNYGPVARAAIDKKGLGYFGPFPDFVQNGPKFPVLNGNADAFLFVGQFKASKVGLCAFSFYLFYDPITRTVAQYQQMT